MAGGILVAFIAVKMLTDARKVKKYRTHLFTRRQSDIITAFIGLFL
jgi:small neutral amino acid transporter SnatA (MarC family)